MDREAWRAAVHGVATVKNHIEKVWFEKRVVTAEKSGKILRCFILSMKQFDKLMDV